ncbi:hypothetical protein Cni_G28923 [Canna indica]|uniref:Uncharacterized protein n=1 Tax=Canna indica TaxID=4628 RepID=A0AAQ3QP68_9LILI|nr:hypothetical protein Cni_G28923 [Canna indica]
MARGDNPTLPSWLFSSVHNGNTNTILHLASEKCHTKEGDAVQMQDKIKWFEEVKDMIPKELVYSRNKDEKTAQEVFTKSHKGMLEKCKEQLMEMGKTCSGSLQDLLPRLRHWVVVRRHVTSALPVPRRLPQKEQQFRRAIPTKYLFACLSFAIVLVTFLVSFACNMFLQIYGGQKRDEGSSRKFCFSNLASWRPQRETRVEIAELRLL